MSEDRAIGCMIAAASGDSLGAAVEFMSLSQIRRQYGPDGIIDCVGAYGLARGAITDDTQMAMATAQGLLSILEPQPAATAAQINQAIWQAYQQWLVTQRQPDQRRAPGNTCLSALRGGRPGSQNHPLNQSAGCGAIMRVHPVGIAYADKPDRALPVGLDSGALTHGHVNGYVPAGAFAALLAWLMHGNDFPSAVATTQQQLLMLPAEVRAGTLEAISIGMTTPLSDDPGVTIDTKIRCCGSSGGGWQGHDALAITLYAIRHAPTDPLAAIRIAVNHSGDSDSTGSLAGAVMGALYGAKPFDAYLTERQIVLEHRAMLTQFGQRLCRIQHG